MSDTPFKRYNPTRHEDWNYGGSKWKLSRSKIDFFMECQRCFYLDNRLGTKRPGFPAFNLNLAVDELFKKEFDVHRAAKSVHPLCATYNVDAIPFAHKDLEAWRENFVGITHTHKETGLIISGAVDDVWQKPDGTLIIVDYKSTSKDGSIKKLGDSPWEQQYTRQLGVYKWLLEHHGFTVNSIGYLVYANASRKEETFNNTLVFETTLVECPTDTAWIEPTLIQIKACLESPALPPIGNYCEFCPYRDAAGKKFLAIHNKTKHSVQ